MARKPVKDVCNILLKTYNTNILDQTSKTIRDIFYTESKKNIKTRKGRRVLIELILNHIKPKISFPKFIGGPISVELHQDKKGMSVYTFGEFHDSIMDCTKPYTPVENYFLSLINNTDVFLDIFIEIPRNSHNYIIYNRMGQIYKKLKHCIINKDEKDCKLARIHYIDIRKGDENLNILSYYRKITVPEYKKINSKSRNYILETFRGLISPDYLNFCVGQIRTNKFVAKELERSYRGNDIYIFIRNKIIEFSQKNREIWVKYIPNILENFPASITDRKNEFILKTIYHSTIDINSYVHDAYALSRVFKVFRPSINNDQPSMPNNIILYTGIFHSGVYREFLETIGFQRMEQTKFISKNCVDMSGIKQPLFSSLGIIKN